jgi:hypothetical protein
MKGDPVPRHEESITRAVKRVKGGRSRVAIGREEKGDGWGIQVKFITGLLLNIG